MSGVFVNAGSERCDGRSAMAGRIGKVRSDARFLTGDRRFPSADAQCLSGDARCSPNSARLLPGDARLLPGDGLLLSGDRRPGWEAFGLFLCVRRTESNCFGRTRCVRPTPTARSTQLIQNQLGNARRLRLVPIRRARGMRWPLRQVG